MAIEDLHGCCMSTRDHDTAPDPAPTRERSGDATDPMPAVGAGGAQAAGTSRLQHHRSEPEPMDVILRKIVEATPNVPNSLEQGVSYQASHAPAHAHQPTREEPRVLLNITTDPGSRFLPSSSDGRSATRLTLEAVEIPRGGTGPFWIFAGVFAGVVVIGGTTVVALELRHASVGRGPAVAAPSRGPVVVPLPSSTPVSTPVAPSRSDVGPVSLPSAEPSAAVATSRRVSFPPPQVATSTFRAKAAPAGTAVPPSSLINQAPL
jgi:hypothetical protein